MLEDKVESFIEASSITVDRQWRWACNWKYLISYPLQTHGPLTPSTSIWNLYSEALLQQPFPLFWLLWPNTRPRWLIFLSHFISKSRGHSADFGLKVYLGAGDIRTYLVPSTHAKAMQRYTGLLSQRRGGGDRKIPDTCRLYSLAKLVSSGSRERTCLKY